MATQSSDKPERSNQTNVTTLDDIKDKSSDGASSAAAKSEGSKKPNRKAKLAAEHLDTVVKQLGYNDLEHLYVNLEGLSSEDVSRVKQGNNTTVDVEKEARNVFKAWMNKGKSKATRQAVLDALVKCGNKFAHDALKELWPEDKGVLKDDDISDIIEEGQLGPNDIKTLFGAMGLTQAFVDRKCQAERLNVEHQAKAVFTEWIKNKTPTVGELLEALEKAGNVNASEKLQEIWGIVEKEETRAKDFPGDGQKLGGNSSSTSKLVGMK